MPRWVLEASRLPTSSSQAQMCIRDRDLLTQAPSEVDEKQLRELHIRLRNAEAK